MNDSELRQLIAQAQAKQWEKLDLSGRGLKVLPPEIGNLTNLQQLNLYNNQITALPEAIGKLTNLQQLDLRYNQITALPEAIGNLTNMNYYPPQAERVVSASP